MKKNIFISRFLTAVFILTFIVQFFPASTLFAYESRTSLQGEIVRDILNYSDEEASLIGRLRFSENIDDIFMLNFSLLRDINNERDEYTWNIGLKDLYDHIDFIAGNYNLRFGSGLIMGKKQFITSDSFSRSLTVSYDETIIPATGTNPSGTFFGTTAKIYSAGDQCAAGLIPFFSSQKRFITPAELEQGYVQSSLPTLTERTDKDSKYSEFINIVNYGGMIWFSFIDYFTIQGYGFTTEINDPERDNIKWEYNTTEDSGIKRYRAGGIFIEYNDEIISLFIEPVFSSRYYNQPLTGYAFMWGCGVKSRTLLLSARGKNCTPDFRSEYASGDRNPENAFEIKTGLIPIQNFELGALLYSEKNINPSYNSDSPGGAIREEFYTGIKPLKWIKLDLTAARVRSYRDDSEPEKIKLSSSALFSLPWNIFFRLKSDIQRVSSSSAYVSACELKYLFYNYFTLSAGYTEIRAGDESGIYAAIIPASEAEMCTSLYRENTKGCAIKLRYRKEEIFFHARGSLILAAGESEATAESSLGFIF